MMNMGLNFFGENVNTSPKSKDVETTNSTIADLDVALRMEFSALYENATDRERMDRGVFNLLAGDPRNVQSEQQALAAGLTFYNHMVLDIPKAKTKATVKTSLSRGSTLMKPTASQLAKQNRPREIKFQKPLLQNSERSLENPSGFGSQASKRQKLEGGHLHKVVEIKQQATLMHKLPKRDGAIDGSSVHAKPKLTIPREPDLETAHRMRRTSLKNGTELREHMKPTAHIFKARPLNRKILEAPSLALLQKSTPQLPKFQLFRMKSSERAMQHPSAVLSSLIPHNKTEKLVYKPNTSTITQSRTTDSKRSCSVDAPQQEGYEVMHKFKARPLNKKIFSSKGDIGVFRNIKREATVPREFNFQTDKRFQHNPPVELFNKLSLTSKSRQHNVSQQKLPQPTCVVPTKDLKENTLASFQQEHGIAHVIKEKPQRFGRDGGLAKLDLKPTRAGA